MMGHENGKKVESFRGGVNGVLVEVRYELVAEL
jgi:hypothetical protein